MSKKITQRKTNRLFSKLTKISFKNSLIFFEYNILNYLVKSNFVFSKKEALILLKNKKIFVNGFIISNPFYCLKKGDVVQTPISSNVYNYY